MEGTVPGRFELEEGPLVLGKLQVAAREQPQREYVDVFSPVPFGAGPYPPDHQLLAVLPLDLALLVAQCYLDPPLHSLVKEDDPVGWQSLGMVHQGGHVLSTVGQFTNLKVDEDIHLTANVGIAEKELVGGFERTHLLATGALPFLLLTGVEMTNEGCWDDSFVESRRLDCLH